MISQVLIFAAAAVITVSSIGPVLDYQVPQPYKFGYDIKDKHGEQYRQETGDGHTGVKGSYGFVDDRGIKRQVDYVADKLGFRAQVKTNEPGTANQDPAAVKMISTGPYVGGYKGLGYGAVGYGGYPGGYGAWDGGYGYGGYPGGYGAWDGGYGYGGYGLY